MSGMYGAADREERIATIHATPGRELLGYDARPDAAETACANSLQRLRTDHATVAPTAFGVGAGTRCARTGPSRGAPPRRG
jgi:hypothetical protein